MNALMRRLGLCGTSLFLAGILLPVLFRARRLERGSESGSCTSADYELEVIIPAYRESGVIGSTIDSLRRALETSEVERWSVCVAAGDDATARAAVRADKVLRLQPRGKADAINRAVQESTATHIVLTDANCRLTPDDWPTRLASYLDAIDLVSVQKREFAGRETLYWRYEAMVKGNGRHPLSTLSVVGECLAFKRSDYKAISDTVWSDDLQIAMCFNRRGLTVGVVPDVCAVEEACAVSDQWVRRVRIATGQLSEALPRTPELVRTSAGRAYLAHKMFRLTCGAIGFWLFVLSASACFPLLGALIAPLVVYCVASSMGRLNNRWPAGPLVTLVGLQAVPIVGATTALRRRIVGGDGRWKKIER